jgi:hypothetical protein
MPPWAISRQGSTLRLSLAGEVLGWQDIERMLDSAEPSFAEPEVATIEIDLVHVGSLAVGAIGILLAWKAEIAAEGKDLRFAADGTVSEQLSRFGLLEDLGQVPRLKPLRRLKPLPRR